MTRLSRSPWWLLIGLGLAALVVVFWISRQGSSRLVAETEWSRHHHQVIVELRALRFDLADAEHWGDRFLIEPNSRARDRYEGACRGIAHDLDVLSHLVAGNAVEQRQIRALSPQVRERVAVLSKRIETAARLGARGEVLSASVPPDTQLEEDVEMALSNVQDEELRELDDHDRAATRSAQRLHRGGFVNLFAGVGLLLGAVVDRVFAERALRRREAQLSDAQAIAHIGRFELDLERGRFAWSDEMYRIAGLDPHSVPLTRDLVTRLFGPEQVLALENSAAGTSEILDFEHTVHRVDGTERIVRTRVRGSERTIVGTTQDITEQRRAERALLESETRLRFIVSHLPVIVWSTDDAMRITSLIGSGFEMISREQMAKFDIDVSDLINLSPSGPSAVEHALRGVGGVFEVIFGGRELRVRVEPLRSLRGGVTGTVGIAFDVSDERRAEREKEELLEQLHEAANEWRDTFDSIDSPIIIVDDGDRVRRMNAAALRRSRFDIWTDAIGTAASELGDDAIWRAIGALAIRGREEGVSATLRAVDDHGTNWHLLASTSATNDSAVIIASDVTEIARMQEELRRSERMSEMGRLVAGVAHEVRNPLFGISASLDAFEAVLPAPEHPLLMSALRQQVDRLADLMHELLEYGRPSTPREMVPMDVGEVVRTAVGGVEPLARRRDVSVIMRGFSEQIRVTMDRGRLMQVFENLLKNAVEHSPAGATIEVSACGRQSRVTVAVEDRGPGFRENEIAHIFEPFFTRRRGGTGLGLSIVSRIVEDHAGTVQAINRKEGGARFVVTLPIA